MDEDFNLENEFTDVLMSHPIPMPPSSSEAYMKKSSIFKQEIQKQLEVIVYCGFSFVAVLF